MAWSQGGLVMSKKNRRPWSPNEKLRIVLETMQSDRKLAEICRREGLSPTLVYQWRKRLMSSAPAVFASKRPERPDHRVERLSAENARMKSVIAEITAENLDLKKTLSD
jgi:transposase